MADLVFVLGFKGLGFNKLHPLHLVKLSRLHHCAEFSACIGGSSNCGKILKSVCISPTPLRVPEAAIAEKIQCLILLVLPSCTGGCGCRKPECIFSPSSPFCITGSDCIKRKISFLRVGK